MQSLFRREGGMLSSGHLEKKMETLGPFKGIYRAILGLYWGYIGVILG